LVDLFTLALTHGLMAIALWRLLFRPDLDVEEAAAPRRPWVKPRPQGTDEDAGDA